MKDEIKIRSIEQQAIDNLKAIINSKDKIIEIEPPLEETCQILLDYITNLKKKITFNEKSRRKMQQSLMEQIETYKSRNEKAIEYINHENFKRTILVGVGTKKYTRNILDKVLNILNGGDKDE